MTRASRVGVIIMAILLLNFVFVPLVWLKVVDFLLLTVIALAVADKEKGTL